MTIQELNQDRLNGLIKSSTYVRMAIALSKGSRGYDEEYSLNLGEIVGVEESLKFQQLLQMSADKLIEINGAIDQNFPITWTQAALLPNYTKLQITEWKNSGLLRKRGLLYFALAADNPNKTPNQMVDVQNLRSYGFNDEDIFCELTELSAQKTLSTELTNVLIRWIQPSEKTTTGDDQRFTDLQTQIAALISNPIDLTAITAQLESIFNKNAEQDNKDFSLENRDNELELSLRNLSSTLNEKDSFLESRISVLTEQITNLPQAAPPVFTEATLLNNWKRYGSFEEGSGVLYGLPGFWKIENEMMLVGIIEDGTIGQPAFVLPENMRPEVRRTFSSFSSDKQGFPESAYLEVRPNGQVIPLRGNNGAFGLEGVRFVIGTSTPTPANTNTNAPAPAPTMTYNYDEVARNAEVTVSSEELPNYAGFNLIDNNSSTRWATALTPEGVWPNSAWISLDLMRNYLIGKIRLQWEFAHAKSYKVLGGSNGTDYPIELATVTNGNGGLDEFIITPTNCRYIKVEMTERGTEYGYSLWSAEIFNAF